MMRDRSETAVTGKRLVLLGVAALLSIAAALAIGILLLGDFGATEGRVLATTAVLAGYGLLALPAAILQDQRQLLGLAAAVVGLAAAAAALSVVAVWQHEPPDVLGKAIGTVTGWLLAAAQVSALAARHGERDPRAVRRLFAGSSVLAAVVAAMFTALLWAEIDREGFARGLAALVVLDALLVTLQPILARVRPAGMEYRLRVVLVSGETVELSVEAADLAAAATKAIRTLERDGRRVHLLEVTDPRAEWSVAAAGEHEEARAAVATSADPGG